MAKFVRVAAVMAVVCGGLMFAGRTAQAAPFDHIDQLALKLRSQSSQLYGEFRTHFRHAAHSRQLMSDAASLYNKANHLHDVAHTGNINHMASDVAELDRLFHHLEGLVREIRFDAQGGNHHHFGHGGHIHGDTRHVRRLMNEMEDTLHHLRDDIEQLRRNRPGVVPFNGNRPGVTFGNSNFRLRFGF